MSHFERDSFLAALSAAGITVAQFIAIITGSGSLPVTVNEFHYSGDGSTTSFTGADLAGHVLSYTAGSIIVTLDGIQVLPASITATDGVHVVFGTAPANGQDVLISVFTA